MQPSPKILLIECWLGPLPPWRPIYEASCKANPHLDFLVLTDQVNSPKRDANIIWEPITGERLEELIKEHYRFQGPLGSAWDLTKLKPAYGALFSRFLTGYQFWGFHDSDLVWGDTRRFLTEERLAAYDVLTASAAWMVGHFSIFKLNTSAALPHLLIADYWNLIQKENHKGVCVDEEILDHALARMERQSKIRVLRAQWLLGDGLHPRWKKRALERLRSRDTDDDDYVFEHGQCRWDGLSVVHEATGREALYFHFQHWKRKYSLENVSYSPLVAEYRFRADRIEAVRFKSHGLASLIFWIRHEFSHRLIFALKSAKAAAHHRLEQGTQNLKRYAS